MDWKLELVAIPVTDVDRAKAFYVDQVGFHADHDHQVTDDLRFVQLTPPGSACLLREAEKRHGDYEATAPKHHWSEWYAAYIVARERGKTSEEAAKDGARQIEQRAGV